MDLDDILPSREPDEKVKLVLHRHWFIFVRSIIVLILVGLVPVAAYFIWSQLTTWQLAPDSLGYALLVSGAAVFYLFLWVLMYGFWLDYYLDIFIVTDHRVVDIEQSGLFSRTVAEERINRIQDVTSEIKGALATFLHYGNVYVQTAGKTERFIFEQVPHPEKVAQTILAMIDKHEDKLDHHLEHHHDLIHKFGDRV